MFTLTYLLLQQPTVWHSNWRMAAVDDDQQYIAYYTHGNENGNGNENGAADSDTGDLGGQLEDEGQTPLTRLTDDVQTCRSGYIV